MDVKEAIRIKDSIMRANIASLSHFETRYIVIKGSYVVEGRFNGPRMLYKAPSGTTHSLTPGLVCIENPKEWVAIQRIITQGRVEG